LHPRTAAPARSGPWTTRQGRGRKRVKAAAEDARRRAAAIELPEDLVDRVRDYLDEHPEKPWDSGIARLAENFLPGAGSDHGSSRAPPQ